MQNIIHGMQGRVAWGRADAVICTEDEDIVARVREITGEELAYGERLSPLGPHTCSDASGSLDTLSSS